MHIRVQNTPICPNKPTDGSVIVLKSPTPSVNLIKKDNLTKRQAPRENAGVCFASAQISKRACQPRGSSSAKNKCSNLTSSGTNDIFRKTLLPITKMEKLMGKQGVAEILGSLILKPVGKPTLTPSSEKRPVITNAK